MGHAGFNFIISPRLGFFNILAQKNNGPIRATNTIAPIPSLFPIWNDSLGKKSLSGGAPLPPQRVSPYKRFLQFVQTLWYNSRY